MNSYINFYLNNEPMMFDFTYDCIAENKELYMQIGTYSKYFTYKALAMDKRNLEWYESIASFKEKAVKEYKCIGDPDNDSKLLQEIYKELWPNIELKTFMYYKNWIQSDTMTSVQHTMNKFVEKYLSEEIKNIPIKITAQ